jgi:hypothetical protein
VKIGDKPRRCNKYIVAASVVAFFLIIMIPIHSVLANTEHAGGNKPTSNRMFFKVLKGDLNVCSPNYQYNITICQMVMKNEELSPYIGKGTNSTNTNNATKTINFTNSNGYPPLSVNPEMVISEEELQALLTNSTLNTPEGIKNLTKSSNDTQDNELYVDEHLQYEPQVIEQPLEKETTDNSLRPWQSNHQPLLMNNQTASNRVHDLEEPVLSKNPVWQQDNLQDSLATIEDSLKSDTSNLYSSIPIGVRN